LLAEQVGEPPLVAVELPPPVDDEQAVELGREHGVDDVGDGPFGEVGPERAGTGEGLGDDALSLLALAGELVGGRRRRGRRRRR